MTTSVPVPALDRDLIARLRFDVIASSWTIDTLEALLSADTLAALMRDSRLPALVELAGVADPAATLTRFFILGQPERADAWGAGAGDPRPGGRHRRGRGRLRSRHAARVRQAHATVRAHVGVR